MSNEKVHAIVGPPGCGKTQRVAELVSAEIEVSRTAFGSLDRRPIVVCSLTKSAAAEAASRIAGSNLPGDCVGTLHSFAFRALGGPKIAETQAADFCADFPEYQLSGAGADVDDALPDLPAEHAPGDALSQGYYRVRSQMVDRDKWPSAVRRFGEAWETWKKSHELLDFTDLIEIAARDGTVCPGEPRSIVIDESQDCSRLMLELARVWALQCERLTLVGDPWQSLYVWCGAYPEMFRHERTKSREVLAKSFRVPRVVHGVAQRWARRLSDWEAIDYDPRDEEGCVCESPANWKQPEILLDEVLDTYDRGLSLMICAACSYMLAPTLALLRQKAIPFGNPWRFRRGDWNPLARSPARKTMADRIGALLRPVTVGGSFWTWNELNAWVAPLDSKGAGLSHGAKSWLREQAKQHGDREADFSALLDVFPMEIVRMLQEDLLEDESCDVSARWWGRSLLAAKQKTADYPLRIGQTHGWDSIDDRPRVYVGTIHSFKGAEADTVIVYPDLSNRAAIEQHAGTKGADSIVRLGYVAITRAREKLMITLPAGPDFMPLKEAV